MFSCDAKQRFHLLAILSLSLGVVIPLGAHSTEAAEPADRSLGQLLSLSEVQGGLVVQVACGDGKAISELEVNDRYLLQGLDQSAEKIALARASAASAGREGKLSFRAFDGKHLPYIDRLVNLLIVEKPAQVAADEILRVLVPGGVAFIREASGWRRVVKPRDPQTDQWTHYLHGPDNNAVAQDSRVGPPTHLQWKAGSSFARHHDFLASLSAMVSSDNRVYYITDEGETTIMNLPPKWTLVARDAFNGKLLWKRTLGNWVNYLRRFRSGPDQLARRLVAADGRVFVTLNLQSPTMEFDGATGELLRTFAGSENTDEIIYQDGLLLLVTLEPGGDDKVQQALRRGEIPQSPRKLLAYDLKSGKQLWQCDDQGPLALSLAVSKKNAFFTDQKSVVCLDLKTGQPKWRQPRGTASTTIGPTVVVSEKFNVLLVAHGPNVVALSMEDGKQLWKAKGTAGFKSPMDVFVAKDLVWLGMFAETGRHPVTGEIKHRIDVGKLLIKGHHARCYRNKATENFLIYGRHGLDFFNMNSDDHDRAVWTRGVCQYGILPCNGLIYAPPNACGCYAGVMVRGFNVFSAQRESLPARLEPSRQSVTRGPAYQKTDGSFQAKDSDWPTFRFDGSRKGASDITLAEKLTRSWKTKIGGKLTQPVVAGGKLLVASVDQHKLYALDEANGKTAWTFQAGARIDSPPTIFEGKVYFGCRDGKVYCLALEDGALAWSFRAAPLDQWTMIDNQLESVWPVAGNVLIQNSVAYVVAGRSSYLDGGLFLYGLNAQSGDVEHTTTVFTDQHTDQAGAFTMAGTKSDILVGDGERVFLKTIAFDSQLRVEKERHPHLFSHSGFVDDSWFYRTLMVLGYGTQQTLGNVYANFKYDSLVPYGQLLAFNNEEIYGLQTTNPHRIQKSYVESMSQCEVYKEKTHPLSPGWKGTPNNDDFPPKQKTRKNKEPREYQWRQKLPFQPRALFASKENLYIAGWPAIFSKEDPYAAIDGKHGGLLWKLSAEGTKVAEYKLDSPPVYEGVIGANGALFLSLKNGEVVRMD